MDNKPPVSVGAERANGIGEADSMQRLGMRSADNDGAPTQDKLGLVGVGGVCPTCLGVSQHPEVEGCRGCFDCDFFGTLEGYQTMQQMMNEGYEAKLAYIRAGICEGCGACSAKEAETKCRPRSLADTGDYWCEGEELWEDERDAESEAGGGGAEQAGDGNAETRSRAASHTDLRSATGGADAMIGGQP